MNSRRQVKYILKVGDRDFLRNLPIDGFDGPGFLGNSFVIIVVNPVYTNIYEHRLV